MPNEISDELCQKILKGLVSKLDLEYDRISWNFVDIFERNRWRCWIKVCDYLCNGIGAP